MKVACIVIGSLLLLLGLSRVPNLLSFIDQEDEAKLFGRVIVVGAEVVIGAGLVFFGVRGKRKSS
jgi:hypothetical protein